MSKEKSPAGAATPDEEEHKKTQLHNIIKRSWMASADTRCWHCERFKEGTCNGLIDYHWRDCPIYRRGR